jgi:UrcA family protein
MDIFTINQMVPGISLGFVAIFGTILAYFAFAHLSCALHQSFKQQLNVGQRHRNFSTLSHIRSYPMRFTLPLFAFAIAATPVLAAPQAAEQTVTVRIAYGDVDVASAEGRAVIEARIDAKLRKACAADTATRYTHGRATIDDKCVADAKVAALAEVERVAAAEGRSGRAIAAN